jgi:outer membrane cobalamin receptor
MVELIYKSGIAMKNQKKFRLNQLQAGVVALVLGLCSVAQADSSDMGSIQVNASRGTQLQDMDVSTTVLTREQILNAPESTVDQLLGTIPGIFIPNQPSTQLHPTGQVLSMRGFGTSTNGLTLVLLDGVPLNDPYFRTVNWGQVPKDSIERIEVIRGGGATSLWGNMALGGVINIVTRQPQDGEKHIQVGVGSFNTETVDASVGTALSDELKLALNYGASNSGGYNQTPTQYQNPNMVPTASQVGNFNAALNYQPNAVSHYFLKLQASNTKENGLIWNDARNEWDTYRLTFGGKTKLSDHSSVNFNGWAMSGSMSTQNATDGSFTIGTPSLGTPYVSQLEKAQYQSTGGSAYWQTEFDRIKDIKIGVDMRSNSVNDPVNV